MVLLLQLKFLAKLVLTEPGIKEQVSRIVDFAWRLITVLQAVVLELYVRQDFIVSRALGLHFLVHLVLLTRNMV